MSNAQFILRFLKSSARNPENTLRYQLQLVDPGSRCAELRQIARMVNKGILNLGDTVQKAIAVLETRVP